MAVIQGTLLDEGGAVYNVQAYGLAGDGSTDDTADLKALIAAVPTDSTLLFPSGTYLLSTWSVETLAKRLRLQASEPGVVLKGPAAATHFAAIQADLELIGLAFERWGTVLVGQGSGPVDSVSVSRCRATDAQYFLNWTWSGQTDPEDQEYVRRLLVEDCLFEGLTYGVLYGSMNADEIVVRNNSFVDNVRYVCRFLGGQVQEDGQNTGQGRVRLLFSGNYVKGLTQGTFTGAAAVAVVVQASAERIELVNNFVREVSTLGNSVSPLQGEARFAYITSSRLYVAGNLCWDVGAPASGVGIIHEKNPDMTGSQVIGNSFFQSEANTAVVEGIQISGRDVLVDGVFATGLRGSVVAADRVRGGKIANVVARDHRGPTAIVVQGGRDVEVDAPQILGHINAYTTGQPRAIAIETRNDPVGEDPTINDMTNIRVVSPMIRDAKTPGVNAGVGINVWAKAGTIRQVAVHGGSIMGCDRAFELSESAGAAIEDVEILDTDMRNNRVSIVNPTAPATLIVRDSQGYRTENAGTATLGAAATSVNVSHGLARAPLLSRISVTPASSLGGAAKFWISTPTSSQFTIHTDAAPGAAVTFAWQADAEEV